MSGCRARLKLDRQWRRWVFHACLYPPSLYFAFDIHIDARSGCHVGWMDMELPFLRLYVNYRLSEFEDRA